MPAKKDPYSSHGMKIISLFARLLFSGQPHGLIELSKFLNCSKQTVSKLIEEIRMSYGVDIEETIADRRRYYQIKRPSGIIPALYFSEQEISVLQMCKVFADHLLGRDQIRTATQAIDKTMGLSSNKTSISVDHFAFHSYGRIDYTAHQQVLADIIESIQKRRICKVSYRRIMAKRSKSFFIKPLKLFSFRDALYLNAQMARYPGRPWSEPDFDPLLAVHRIKQLEITNRKFQFPKGYDFDKAFEQYFGIIKEDRFKVDIEFTGWAAAFIQERKWSKDQKIIKLDDDSIRVSFTASSEHEITSWVLFYGEEARVLKPGWLVDLIKERVGKMYKIHHPKGN